MGSILAGTADDLGPAGRDDFFGYGRINAEKAVAAALGTGSYALGNKRSPDKGAIDPKSRFAHGAILVKFKKRPSRQKEWGFWPN